MLPLLPLAVGGLGALAVWRASRLKMTPARRVIYEQALATLKDPAALRTLADAYEKVGLKDEATLLRKRAALRELPDDTTKARREAFKKGMQSKDPAAIEALAAAFEKEGATSAAKALRDYAQSVGLQQGIVPATPTTASPSTPTAAPATVEAPAPPPKAT